MNDFTPAELEFLTVEERKELIANDEQYPENQINRNNRQINRNKIQINRNNIQIKKFKEQYNI